MHPIEPKRREIEVVFIGRFNPAIIQPGWFAKYGIVGEEDAKSAKINLVHPELTVINFALFDLHVETGKFSVKTRDIHPEIIRDFLLKTFGQFLIHTPIRLMGINLAVELECPSAEVRDAFGKRLAPREAWGGWAKMIEGEKDPTSTQHGGLVSISMRQSKRPDEHLGYIQVKLEPNLATAKNIFIHINDHHELGGDSDDTSRAMEILEKGWEESLKYSQFIMDETAQEILRTPIL